MTVMNDAEIVREFCREALKVLPTVERVLVNRERDVLSIWVIVDEVSYEERMKLYEVENDFAVRYEHPTLMFETVWRQGRRLADLCTFPGGGVGHDCYIQ